MHGKSLANHCNNTKTRANTLNTGPRHGKRLANQWQPMANKHTIKQSQHMASTGQGDGKCMANQWQIVRQASGKSVADTGQGRQHRWQIGGKHRRWQTQAKDRAHRWQIGGKWVANRWQISGKPCKHAKMQSKHMSSTGQRSCEAMANQ